MSKYPDCFFFIDTSIPEDEQHMSVLCVECHDAYYPKDFGWFYRGSIEGYGPFEYRCERCQKAIYVPKKR